MKAPELIVSKWLNVDSPLSLQIARGKVIAIHAFQMLCPGCVLHGIPQAQKLFDTFNNDHVIVMGLHTVFEHHAAMQEESLKAFLHEFHVKFPIAIDEPSNRGHIPKTMEAYQMRGTPTWVLIDRNGEIRNHTFGQMDDMFLGAEITKFAIEGAQLDVDIYSKKLRKS